MNTIQKCMRATFRRNPSPLLPVVQTRLIATRPGLPPSDQLPSDQPPSDQPPSDQPPPDRPTNDTAELLRAVEALNTQVAALAAVPPQVAAIHETVQRESKWWRRFLF
ncbi:hypothetical protein HER10_EVM0012050 [Colletotrichum scovillei]|uniref:uncharacterized protein n=1 Tax=Colletotrichum scovillei TaxID=1209932 RepID=UPI0015C354FE|nr:uncharacterized protein HER10_EVM0012050 [Colletotrichum scovillei]KAF4777165.1 hypothetical protein HER10_EVM0012050 [Colletotrichum scovillei]